MKLKSNDLLSMSLNTIHSPFHFKLHSKFQKVICKLIQHRQASVLYRHFNLYLLSLFLTVIIQSYGPI